VFFTSEVPWTTMPDFYRYADVFVHASLSETYGNVLGEALWCGTPVVAIADGMGVTAQVQDGVNGILFAPGKGHDAETAANVAFGRTIVELIRDPQARARLGRAAARRSRERCSPFAVQHRIADAFQHAQDHAVASGLRPVADPPAPRPSVDHLQWPDLPGRPPPPRQTNQARTPPPAYRQLVAHGRAPLARDDR